jgi:hypothetical protein
VLLAVAACAPRGETPKPALGLDCSIPFKDLAAALTAQPGIKAAPADPSEPYRYYSTADLSVSYIVTQTDAPAHPAILMQRAAGGQVTTSGCAYGDRGEFDKLKAYIESLKANPSPPPAALGREDFPAKE